MKKNPLLFALFVQNDREYSTLHLTVLEPKPGYEYDYRELFSFKWQSDSSDRGRWYGLSMDAGSRDHSVDFAARLKRAAKLMDAIFPAAPEDSPRAVLDQLCELGISRAAYDGRVSRYVREVDAIDPALKCYLDDRPRYDKDAASGCGCMVKGLAANEADAQKVLEKQWLDTIAKGYAKAEQFAAWVTAGKPVRTTHFDKPAVFAPISEILHEPNLVTPAESIAA